MVPSIEYGSLMQDVSVFAPLHVRVSGTQSHGFVSGHFLNRREEHPGFNSPSYRFPRERLAIQTDMLL